MIDAILYPFRALCCLWNDIRWYFHPHRTRGVWIRTKPLTKADLDHVQNAVRVAKKAMGDE